jgi:branched-chain amino acid transport system permease protein
MIAYVLTGLVIGGIYSISAASMVITYVSAGVLNFAFGSIAFFIARLYYYLDVQANWGIVPAAIVAILIVGPLLGVVLYLSLFKYLSRATALTKVVATIGLSVAIPAIAQLCSARRRSCRPPDSRRSPSTYSMSLASPLRPTS